MGNLVAGKERRLFSDEIIGTARHRPFFDKREQKAPLNKFGLPRYDDDSVSRGYYDLQFYRDNSIIPVEKAYEIAAGEPKYLDDRPVTRKFKRYAKEILNPLNEYLAEKEGKILNYRELKVGEMEEPLCVIVWDGRQARLAKILGMYNTETKNLKLSPDLKDEDIVPVSGHEAFHYAQDELGLILKYIKDYGKNARNVIENEAEKAANEIYGSPTGDYRPKHWLN